MAHWNQDAVNDSLRWKLEETQRYLKRLHEHEQAGHSVDHLIDEYVAMLDIYNYITDRSFSDTREHFVAALRKRRSWGPAYLDGCADKNDATRLWYSQMDALLAVYEPESQSDMPSKGN